jgi:3-(3-hydroxy-phenyl)propionate hydroxylase
MSAGTGPEVLVVGMGPSGVALAGLLGQRGIRTAVFDRLPGLFPLPRAAGMDHEVMRIAQELGVAEQLAEVVVPYRASEYRGVGGTVIKRLDSPPPPHRLGWDPMFAFDQPAFEAVLRRRVGELPAVTVALEAEVVAVGQDDDGVWADVRDSGATAVRRVRGSYLVACDGGASPVRRQLGITMTDLGFHENWLVVDAIVDDDEVLRRLPTTQVQYCEPGRPATFVNLVGRHRRWEIALDPGELPVGPVDNEAVWPWLAPWIRPGEARIWRAAAYMFHGLVADRWRAGRILLAGDAAHMTPPFMAQGMAQGMRDVQNLAWKLQAVLEGRASDRLLDSYQAERRPHVITTTMHTIELGRVICQRDESLALARDKEMLEAHPGEVPITLRSTFLPPLSDGVLAAHTPGAGQILPQPFIDSGGEERRLDDVIGTGFRVLATSAIDAAAVDRLRVAAGPLAGRVVRVHPPGTVLEAPAGADDLVEQDGVLTGWLAGLDRSVVIVRPDHYVYGTAASVEEALSLLDDLLGRHLAAERSDPADAQ